MPAVVIIGAQWGDEGKGKATDLLGSRIDYVVKFNGGNNAGHTVVIGNQKYALHLLPSGILTEGVTPVIGNGVVIDIEVLFDELDALIARGVDVSKLKVSANAHLITHYHRTLDKVTERFLGSRSIGTTGRERIVSVIVASIASAPAASSPDRTDSTSRACAKASPSQACRRWSAARASTSPSTFRTASRSARARSAPSASRARSPAPPPGRTRSRPQPSSAISASAASQTGAPGVRRRRPFRSAGAAMGLLVSRWRSPWNQLKESTWWPEAPRSRSTHRSKRGEAVILRSSGKPLAR